MSGSDVIVVTAILTLVVSTVGVAYALWGIRKQLWLQTFLEFTKGYSEIVSTLPADSRAPASGFTVAAVVPAQRDEIVNALRAYLNLCSEEFYLRQRGHIDRKTWGIWETGIRDLARLPWLATTCDEYNAYPDFSDFFDDCVAETRRGTR